MSDSTHQLDPGASLRVLTERVIPESALPRTTQQTQPHAIFVAGQPGAGKGGLVDAALAEFFDDAVTIDTDALREHYPGVDKLRQAHPYTWTDHTHPDASAWSKGLREAAVAAGRNIIVDTTLRNAASAIKTIKDLQATGYTVEVRVVAAHQLESKLNADRRFTNQFDQEGYGHHVPEAVHDLAYANLAHNLDLVGDETGVQIRIFSP